LALVLSAGTLDPPPLIEAAKTGDLETLRTLVQEGADVNAIEGDGSTALLWASHRDDMAAVELLIEAGANVDAANDLGATPLWVASQNGSALIVERLLDAGADPNAPLRHGETPLIAASRAGSSDVVEMLLSHGADPDATGPRGQTALMWAVVGRQSDVVGVLVEHGADVHARSEVRMELKAHEPHAHPDNQAWFPHGGNTALMFAARAGDLASARYLVAGGANVNDTSAFGISALTMATYSNFDVFVAEPTFSQGGPYTLGTREGFREGEFAELVEFLLDQGADPNLGSEKFTALHAAVLRRADATVEVLLQQGADPTIPLKAFTPHTRGSNTAFYFHNGWIGATPVWLAARYGTPRTLRMLLEHGAEPNFVHHATYWGGGGGPLGGGMMGGRQEERTTLVMAALGMSAPGRPWVYQFVCSEEHEAEVLEKVRLLAERGANLNVAAADGRMPLDQAQLYGYETVARFLESKGARSGLADDPQSEGESPRRRRMPCERQG
jgi:ankyrin repeat protein